MMHRDPIKRHADKKAADQNWRQGEIRRYAERSRQQIKREHAGDDHGAVSEIDHVHDAPNQGEPHGGEPVDQPHQHAVDDRSENAEHVRL
jgi:hypothetical protein